ncbi:hypothetical protein JCM10450v2_000497 [Rhodotorula kratochvilovae]
MRGLPLDAKPALAAPQPLARIRPDRVVAVLVLIALALFSTSPRPLDAAQDLASSLVRALKPLPKNPYARALRLLEQAPVIDGHIDLEIMARWYYANDLDAFDLRKETRGEVDLPRLRKGNVGGFFHSVFVPCPEDAGYPADNYGNFSSPSFRVRDTLEQIDTARLLIDKYSSDLEYTPTADAWRRAMKRGKVGGMLGVEGGHQLGSSLSTLRAYHALGVRYVTLTHSCHSPLADSCGMQGAPLKPRWNGLSPFGHTAVREMNRLGVAVDISHTAPKTASDVLSHSLAPPIFSHSNARGVHPVVRNVPDAILRRIGSIDPDLRGKFNLSEDGERGQGWGADNGEAKKHVPSGDAIVMLNFAPPFVSEFPGEKDGGRRADVQAMADHADYIGRLAGREHVGIGSDFDGIESTPEGLEDVSTYPNLVAELVRRGWSDDEIRGLTSGNILRILDKVEAVAHSLRHVEPSYAVFEGRTDLVKHDKPPGQ